jgi:hypothetical protein
MGCECEWAEASTCEWAVKSRKEEKHAYQRMIKKH